MGGKRREKLTWFQCQEQPAEHHPICEIGNQVILLQFNRQYSFNPWFDFLHFKRKRKRAREPEKRGKVFQFMFEPAEYWRGFFLRAYRREVEIEVLLPLFPGDGEVPG